MALIAAPASLARGEPTSGGSLGSIGEAGRPLGEDSGPVTDSSIGGMRSGSLHDSSGTVGESSIGGMLSGPVSELSAGAATSGQPVSGGGSIGAASSGAVTQGAPPPLRLERPLSQAELQQLEQQLRAIEPLAE